jgi:hypothetical protein
VLKPGKQDKTIALHYILSGRVIKVAGSVDSLEEGGEEGGVVEA